MTIKNLLDVLPRPAQAVEVVSIGEWETYNLITGIDLPDDYKSYLNIYGTGIIGGVITPYNPFCRRSSWKPAQTCYTWMREALAIKQLQHDFGRDIFPYPVYPEEGGLLPWGGTDNGDQLFWLTQGHPNNWTVVINESRSRNFQSFNYSMTGFIYAWIKGMVKCDLIPYDDIDFQRLFEIIQPIFVK